MNAIDVVVISSDDMVELATQIFNKNTIHFDKFSNNQCLITESHAFNRSGDVEDVQLTSFYEKLVYGISLTKSKYILLMLDDYVVNSVRGLDNLTKVLTAFSPDYVRLRAVPVSGRQLIGFPPFTVTTVQSFYRVNMQPSLWNKIKILEIIESDVTPWKMEIEYGVSKDSDFKLTLGIRKDIIGCEEIIKNRKAKPILSWLCGLKLENVEKLSILEEVKMTLVGFLVSIAFFFKFFRN
jgi:hypothetical protein